MSYDVAFIGTGANPENKTVDGFAMAYRHAEAFAQLESCRLIAAADIVRENGEAFADANGIDQSNVFEDHKRMVEEVEPDIVSICTPPLTHSSLVTSTARSGLVEAIHCEKPMALTWGDAQKMARECDRADVQLTFNHQRRYGSLFRDAKGLLDEGEIGNLTRVKYTWGNFYDNGTHCIDMCNYFNDEGVAEWVLAALDYRTEDVRFGTHNENQILAQWKYENGVHGMAANGLDEQTDIGDWRLEGTEGTIDVYLVDDQQLVIRRDGDQPETIGYEPTDDWIERAIADIVDCLKTDRPCELRAENALKATEIIFGGYESVRRRGRVDFPLTIDDNPLEAMVESGDLDPKPADDAGM